MRLIDKDIEKLTPDDFTGVYKDLVMLIGVESTLILHNNFKGQQVTFGKKLYNRNYVVKSIRQQYDGTNLSKLAIKYDYTERRVRQLLNAVSDT